MANNKLIQILGGKSTLDPSTSIHKLNARQPFYSYFNNQLYIGDGESEKTLSELLPIGAAYLKPGSNNNIDMVSNMTSNFKSGPNTLRFRINTQIEGQDNRFNPGVTGEAAVAFGTGNLAAGNSSLVQGKRNYAGANQTICLGQGNIALGKYSTAFNESNTVLSRSSSVFGSENINFGHSSLVSGYMNISGGHASLVSGRFNIEAYYCYDTQENKLWVTAKNFNGTSVNLNESEDLLIPSTGNLMVDLSTGANGLSVTLGGTKYNLGIGFDDEYTGDNWVIKNKKSNGTIEELTMYVKSTNNRYIAFSILYSNNADIPRTNIISGNSNSIGYKTKNSLILGETNQVKNSENSIVTGTSNKVSGSHNLISGYNNNVSGGYNIVSGADNTTDTSYTCMFGIGLTAGRDNSMIVGAYNKPNDSALFQVGNGGDQYRLKSNHSTLISAATYAALSDGQKANYERNRKNAFTVLKDGHVTVPKVPSTANEVLRYSDLIPNDSGNVSTTNGFSIKVNELKAQKVTAPNFDGLASKATADAFGNTISSTYLSKTAASNTYATKEQLNALDYSSSGSTTKTITSLSQTNGQISASYSNIAFPVTSVAGKTGSVTLAKSDVGLGNVDNTSDATKKANFTGSITSADTGFVTGGAVYTELNKKAAKATTLSGYGITDAYTKSEVTTELNKKANVDDFDNTFEFLTIADGGVLGFKVDANTFTVNNSFTVNKPYYNPVDVAFWKLLVPNGSLTIKSIAGTSVGSSVILKNSKNQEFHGTVTDYNGNVQRITYTCKLK